MTKKRRRAMRTAAGSAHAIPPGQQWLNRRWSCDCTFATVDENVAVQHMQAHFRRRENYRVVLTRMGDDHTAVVEDVRGAIFAPDGSVHDVTLADVKKEATGKERDYHYETIAIVRVMIRDDVRGRVSGFHPADVVGDALRGIAPSVRVIQNPKGEMDRTSGKPIPTYRVMAEARAPHVNDGTHPERRRVVRELATALADLPDDRVAAILAAVKGDGR